MLKDKGVNLKKIILILILFSFALLNAKTWIREYTYQASEADSKLTSRAISLEQVKRLLLQEIGVYVHSTILNEEVEVSGELKELTAKQIEIISAGITETKIIEENWNGVTYYIKAEITADETDVIKRLDNVIEDKEKTKQLEDSRKRTEEALAEIERLKLELNTSNIQNIELENLKVQFNLNKTKLSKIEIEKRKHEIELERVKIENKKLKIQKEYNQSSNELSAEDWFRKGFQAVLIGEYDNAILYFQKSIEIFPSAATYFYMGYSCIEMGNYDIAIECYQNALLIDPTYKGVYNDMGHAYSQKSDYNTAIECYQKALENDPNNAGVYYNMGNDYGRRSDYYLALNSYLKAIEINPDYAEAYYGIGITYSNTGKYDKAIENFQKATVINPGHIDSFVELGRAYMEKGEYDKSDNCIKKAAALGDRSAQEFLKEQGISW